MRRDVTHTGRVAQPGGHRWMVVFLAVGGLQLAGCNRATSHAEHEPPAHVEHVEGTEVSRVTLTPKAMERIDLQTGEVRMASVSRSSAARKVVPYAAVLYDADGATWVYTMPEPNTFVRAEVMVDYIEGNLAVLTDGPPAGTQVVTVGGMELFGTEFEVGH